MTIFVVVNRENKFNHNTFSLYLFLKFVEVKQTKLITICFICIKSHSIGLLQFVCNGYLERFVNQYQKVTLTMIKVS